MYLTLFQLAGIAMLGWLLLILLPAWRGTRWIAETAVFPVFLSLLYVVGLVPLLAELGPGIMRDFGSAEGVTGLLRNPDLALVAWIHILAFDQAVALMIYRDNLRHRTVPLPVQSVILLLTLMFGPLGFLAYQAARAARRGRGETERQTEAPAPAAAAPAGGVVAAVRAPVLAALAVYRRHAALTAVGVLGLALGAACALAIAVRGSALVGAEGHLDKAMTFDIAVGFYVFSVVLLLPLARFGCRGERLWAGLLAAAMVYGFAIENVQVARGIDPRFTQVGTTTDQVLGMTFGIEALFLVALFLVLAVKIARRAVDGADGPLLLAVRYASVATVGAFAAGIWMSMANGSEVGDGASILPLHAIGFHALQAVPLVALMLAWAGASAVLARRWVHAAGIAWLAACAAIA
ncbi:MAG TPA: ABA4-like family protein, partial [Longimicrobium sp.]|nr:ABA4-like family protein [Longimicrobium sp.]